MNGTRRHRLARARRIGLAAQGLGVLAALLAAAGLAASVPSSSSGCERPEAVDTPGFAQRGTAVGDVSGDGRPDRVAVLAQLQNRAGCRTFVVVQGPGYSTRSLALPDALVNGTGANIPWPRLETLARIDERRGKEVVVVIGQGAASVQYAVFGAARSGRLRAFRSGRRLAVFPFGYGNHASTTDCIARAQLVVSTAERAGRAWRVRREFLRVRNATVRRTFGPTRKVAALAQLPEFQEGRARVPFAHCG